MGFDPVKDAMRKAATKQKIIETGFRVFAERTIDAANLTDVANAAGVSAPTVYSYYSSKEPLVMDISVWAWAQYTAECDRKPEKPDSTAAEIFEYYLDSFIDLYRNRRDILRFNQFFNVYVQRESLSGEKIQPFLSAVDALAQRFHICYEKAKVDGTLRTDIPEREIFSRTLHIMLAAVTRYAVGLVYDAGIPPEEELLYLKDVLLKDHVIQPSRA